MKTKKMKQLLILPFLLLATVWLAAQTPVSLNTPNKTRGLTVMQALEKRASATAFSDKALSQQDLSDLLWAANGINRPSEGKRTAPSAINAQGIDLYVLTTEGAYRYDALKHQLIPIVKNDLRAAAADRQTKFANAPVFIVLVSDISRFKSGDEAKKMTWAAMDAGIVSQNISLFCAGIGLQTRVRASMNIETLRTNLQLSPSQHLLLNMPVGH